MELKSKLGLGTVQFGIPYGISNSKGQTSPDEVSNILGIALYNGIDLLDTASSYGKVEKILGQNKIKDFKIVSKYMPPKLGETIHTQFYKSLEDLGVSSIFGYLVHRPSGIKGDPSQWQILNDLKGKGLVEKIGFSLNGCEELEDLLESNFYPDIVQVPYNYFDRRFEGHLIRLKENGCEVHTRSAFLQGLFFINPAELNSFFNEVKPRIKSLQESNEFLSGALLKFVLKKEFVDKVIMGIENAVQLSHNIEALELAEDLPTLNITISEKILSPSNWPKSP